MTIQKIKIPKKKFEINLKFYFFLKNLVKTNLSSKQSIIILETFYSNTNKNFEKIIELFVENLKLKENSKKTILFKDTLDEIQDETDLKLFIFSLNLYSIKDLLLNEAKVINYFQVLKLKNLDPLSLEYDKITLYKPYSTRINGALLSLIFFNKIENNETNLFSKEAEDFIIEISNLGKELIENGIEPNQIFMLMFSESINQSIISDSGSNYEDRILSVLEKIGIDKNKISKEHDKDDSSTEFDFFFEINNKTYGIGAKRTLRERYKQFIKTAQMSKIDIMIEITLGLDLNEEKAKTIRKHNVYLFVSDEIYFNKQYLQDMEGIFPSKELTLDTLSKLS